MSSTPLNSPRHPWRSQPAPAAAPPPDSRRWRREPGSGTARRWGRRSVFGLLTLAFVACAVLLVWAVLWFWPPRPARLVLVGAGYETNLAVPPNVYGREGLNALAAWASARPGSFIWNNGLLKGGAEPTELLTDTAWDRGLNDAGERTVMVVFALHGGADSAGPYLLRGDANPADGDKGRLRLTEILDRLKRLPARAGKLVVLDATGTGADWSLGMLHNDFARALDSMESQIAAVPNLAVVSASGPDQISWPAPGLRRTVFGHYLLQGLKGPADANGDGRVSAWELYQYTADHVEQWARANRGAVQTPVLLPHGAEGERRARSMHLTMVADRGAAAEPSADAPAVTDEALLRRAWDHARELSQLSPPPERYAPHAWARYQAALLRYEQLLRAGDVDHADAVAALLPELEQQIRQSDRLPLASAGNSLAMTALAAPAPPPELAQAWFTALWGAKPEELRAKWDELRAKPDAPADAATRTRLIGQVMGLAIDEAARNPAELGRAAGLIAVLREPMRPAAAEAQFLVMLSADAPKPAPPDSLLSEALKLRRLAEEAALAVRPGDAPYSEQVFPWVRPAVEAADGRRLRGQDLLFAGDPGRLDEATADFRDARKGYEQAAADGAVVTAALDARDQALAAVPAYGRWAAVRPGSDDATTRQADDALMNEIEKIAAAAHRIDEALEKPPADADRAAALTELGRLAPTVREGLKSLDADFLGRADAAAREDGINGWREAEAALAVPFSDAALRLRLIENNRVIEDRLARRAESHNAPPADPERERSEVVDAARRQGRAALAVLGRRVFDAQAAESGAENYDLVQHRLEVFAAEQSWWESAGVAGDQIGRRWRRLAGDATALLDEARKDDLAHAHVALRSAERLGRLAGGAEDPGWDVEPAGRFRRLATHDLLLWQARRGLEDHWFDEKGEPYYQQFARAYVEDAARLVGPAQLRRRRAPRRGRGQPPRSADPDAARTAGPDERAGTVGRVDAGAGRRRLRSAGLAVVSSEFRRGRAGAVPRRPHRLDGRPARRRGDGPRRRPYPPRPDSLPDGDGPAAAPMRTRRRSYYTASSAARRRRRAPRSKSSRFRSVFTTNCRRRGPAPCRSGPAVACRTSSAPGRGPSPWCSTAPAAWASMKATPRRRPSSTRPRTPWKRCCAACRAGPR